MTGDRHRGEDNSVNRADFINHFRRQCGMDYVTACRVFDAMTSLFEDAVARGATIRLGRVGVLVARVVPPREVTMGFERVKGNVVRRRRRSYWLGRRVKWTFRVYK